MRPRPPLDPPPWKIAQPLKLLVAVEIVTTSEKLNFFQVVGNNTNLPFLTFLYKIDIQEF